MRARIPLLVLAAVALGAPCPALAAVGGSDPSEAPGDDQLRDGQPLSLDEAVEIVKKRYEARVLRAEETQEGEEAVYRIRLLDADGRVFTVRVWSRSGKVE